LQAKVDNLKIIMTGITNLKDLNNNDGIESIINK
jgi:hypothetical protein